MRGSMLNASRISTGGNKIDGGAYESARRAKTDDDAQAFLRPAQPGRRLRRPRFAAWRKRICAKWRRKGRPADLPHFAPKAKRVIYLYQAGGPSQLDLFDHKPRLENLRGQNLPESIQWDSG